MDRLRDDTTVHLEVKLASDGIDAKTGTFTGLAAAFGNLDSYGDVIEKGAFGQTLREWEARGKWPPMLLQHGGGWFGGGGTDGIPIGVWTEMEETSRGLKVSGRLDPMDTDEAKKIYAGLKNGSLDGLSIGYKARKFKNGTKPGEPTRTLTDLDLVEVSIVTFPANPKARIAGVKAGNIRTIREFEEFLRDAGGFSHAAARAIASGGFKAADPRDEDAAGKIAAEVLDRLRSNVATLNR